MEARLFCLQLFLVLWPVIAIYSATPMPLRLCRDHYLAGIYTSGVLPLTDGEKPLSGVFHVECQFPEYSSEPHLSVVTTIHNGLERPLSLKDLPQSTVEYQVDWLFLRDIVAESDDCTQDVYVRWQRSAEFDMMNPEELSLNDSEQSQFVIETLNGERKLFYENVSIGKQWEIHQLDGNSAGILHIFPSTSTSSLQSSAELVVSPLRCRQAVVGRSKCLFDLLNDADLLLIDMKSALRAIKRTSGAESLSFSFRTDRPNTPFLSIKTRGGEVIQVDLIDGYLIAVNHIIHPVRLLADGNWHQVIIDLNSLTLRIDNDLNATIISLHSTSTDWSSASSLFDDSSSVAEMSILLNSAQITAVRFLPEEFDSSICSKTNSKSRKIIGKHCGDSQWFCADSGFIGLKSGLMANGPQFVFDRKICSRFESSMSFCNCMGPSSAFLAGDQVISSNRPASCPLEDGSRAVKLTRRLDRLAFIFVPNIPPKTPISIVFKSELDNGLLLFGVWSAGTRSMLMPAEQSTRIQVHFVGETMFAALCVRLTDGSEKCYSCSINRKLGFSTGDWIRVSLFSYEYYYFMTVDSDVCHLSPNSLVPDTSELYKISNSVKNVLLIAGAFYSKSAQLNRRINEDMRRDFYDNTREKPLSLHGCVAEVLIGGVKQDLARLLTQQRRLFAKDADPNSIEILPPPIHDEIFSITNGCGLNCEGERCGNAPCRSVANDALVVAEAPLAECDCSARYLLQNSHSAGCHTNADAGPPTAGPPNLMVPNAIALTSNGRPVTLLSSIDTAERMFSIHQHHRVLRKVWMLLRVPKANEHQHTLLKFGSIEVLVGSRGSSVTIRLSEYDVNEEFLLNANDNRLHLIAIEMNPYIGTAIDRKSLSIRVDNDVRAVFGIATIPFHPVTDQLKIFLVLAGTEKNEEEEKKSFDFIEDSGCLSEFVLSFTLPDENLQFKKSGKSTDFPSQKNLVPLIVDKIYNENNEFSAVEKTVLITATACGARDPTLWFGNSSSWGVIRVYDPSAARSDYTDPITGFISLIVTFLLIFALLLLMCYYCYTRFMSEKKNFHRLQHNDESYSDNNTFSGKASDKYDEHYSSIGSSDEKRPLKPVNPHATTPRNPPSAILPTQTTGTLNSSLKILEGNNANDMGTPSMHFVSPVLRTNYVLVREDMRTPPSVQQQEVSQIDNIDGFVIDQYSSSPSLAARRHRSKAAILLRRPPSPPTETPLIFPPDSDNIVHVNGPLSNSCDHNIGVGMWNGGGSVNNSFRKPSPLTAAMSSYSSRASSPTVTAPIAKQEIE